MKTGRLIWVWMFGAVVATAAEPSLEGYGMRYKPATTNIQWAVTNETRSTFWTYRRTGEAFSGAMISNIVSVCGFSWNERARSPARPRDKNVFYFQRGAGERHYLGIHRDFGRVEFLNEDAHKLDFASGEVPDDQEARKKGFEIVKKLGVPMSELAREPLTGRVRVSRLFAEASGRDKKTGEIRKRVSSRTVFFLRSLDGIDFAGDGTDGGVSITFGNEGKLYEMKIIWPNLTRYKEQKVAGAAEIVGRIRDGKAFMPPGPVSDVIYWRPGLQKLTIHQVRVFYNGRHDEDEKPPEVIYPFATLDVTASYADTNLTSVLNVPFLK